MTPTTIAGLNITPPVEQVLCRAPHNLIGCVKVSAGVEIAQVIKEANEHGWRVHPISTGRNWGMGSFLPKHGDPCLILDLGALCKIGPLDRANSSIRIEPGVTQNQLYEWLLIHAPEYRFNVTGASGETSIIGNAMERGVGYDGSRTDEVFGFEAILHNGQFISPDPLWAHPGGLPAVGPNIEGLFFQSELAVVTAGRLKLRLQQPCEVAVLLSGPLEGVFLTLKIAYEQEVLQLPTHMGGNSRIEMVAQGLLSMHWRRPATAEEARRIFPIVEGHSAITALRGTRRMVRSAVRELKRIAGSDVRVQSASSGLIDLGIKTCRTFGLRTKADFLAAARPLLALTWGEPSEAGMTSIGATIPAQVDSLSRGVVYFNAVSPMDMASSARAENMVTDVFPDVATTRIILPNRGVTHVFTVEFPVDRTEDHHRRIELLCRSLREAGLPPYRLGVVNARDWPALIDDRFDQVRAMLGGATKVSI